MELMRKLDPAAIAKPRHRPAPSCIGVIDVWAGLFLMRAARVSPVPPPHIDLTVIALCSELGKTPHEALRWGSLTQRPGDHASTA
jgi:hypothetical protein